MLESIGQIPVEAAKEHGDKTALVTVDRSLTFNELDALSNRCANALIKLGVSPGDRVTLYSGNCWEWVVSYYGALKTGAVINPINVMSTAGEVEFVANDCGASVIIASHDKALSLQGVKEKSSVREVIAFGDEALPDGMLSFDAILDENSDEFEVAQIEPQATSTIGYTSGTTGRPKGACLSHHSILLNVAATALMHQRSEKDTVVTALPCSHIYGNVMMSGAFQTGMILVLHPLFEEKTILQSIQDHQATLFEDVPTMYMFLLNHPDLDSYDLSSLRCRSLFALIFVLDRIARHRSYCCC